MNRYIVTFASGKVSEYYGNNSQAVRRSIEAWSTESFIIRVATDEVTWDDSFMVFGD